MAELRIRICLHQLGKMVAILRGQFKRWQGQRGEIVHGVLE